MQKSDTLVVHRQIVIALQAVQTVFNMIGRLLQQQLEAILQQKQTTALMVTHDVDESIYLSDRVIVMSRDHGKIIADVHIDLPRPRDRTAPKYHEYVDQLTTILKGALSGGVFTQEDKDLMEFIQGVDASKSAS